MLIKLNYLWRLLATAISFSLFGIGGLLLTLMVFPLINLMVRDGNAKKRMVRRLIHRIFRSFLSMMSFFRMFDFELNQAQSELAKHRGKLVIANHPSLIDVVSLIAIIPNADCIVKEKLWRNPFLQGVVKAADYIKNSEDVETLLVSCQKSLDEGYLLIIFPEGTRTKVGGISKVQRGASNIALRCKADLIPVSITCEPTTLTKNEPWYSIPPKKANFSLSVGKQIMIKDFDDDQQSLSLRARHLTRYIKAVLKKEILRYA